MIDRFLIKLYERLSDVTAPAIRISNDLDDNSNMAYDNFVNLEMFKILVNEIRIKLVEEQKLEESKKPIKKFMYIEDGSVDTDTLINELERTNPEIRVIVYRQGSNPPALKEVDNVKD